MRRGPAAAADFKIEGSAKMKESFRALVIPFSNSVRALYRPTPARLLDKQMGRLRNRSAAAHKLLAWQSGIFELYPGKYVFNKIKDLSLTILYILKLIQYFT